MFVCHVQKILLCLNYMKNLVFKGIKLKILEI